MAEDSLKQKTAKGLFWGGISNGVQQVLVLSFGIYLARTLDADDYGLVGMLAVFSGIAGTIINSGFAVALTNKQDATHKDYNAVFWFTVSIGFLCYVILFFLAPLISQFFNRPELTSLSRVIFLGFFFSGMGMVSHTILFKQLKVKQQAIIDITTMMLSGIMGVILAMRGLAYWALAIQSVTFACVGALLRFFVSPWRPTFAFDFAPLKGMLSFSIKLFLTNIFQQINGNIFSVFLGKFYNAGQVGYYAQGQKWMIMGYQTIGGMINGVSQPVLVASGESLERQRNVFHKLVRFGAFISFPLMLGLAFVGKEFILITIGEKWLPSLFFLQLFCLWGSVGFLYSIYSMLLIAHGKSNAYMYVVVITGMLQLCSVFFTRKLGIQWMVIAYVLSYFVSIFTWQYYAHKYAQIKFIDVLRDISPYLGITVVSFLIAWGITYPIENMYVRFSLRIIISASSYLLISWIGNSIMLKESVSFLFRK